MLTADLAQVRRRGDRLSAPAALGRGTHPRPAAGRGLSRPGPRPPGRRARASSWKPSGRSRWPRASAGWARGWSSWCSTAASSSRPASSTPPSCAAELFSRAAALRRAAGHRSGARSRGRCWPRWRPRAGLTPEAIEQALYADLPEAHRLRAVGPGDAEALVAAYEAGGVAAVLLRATRVRVRVQQAAPLRLPRSVPQAEVPAAPLPDRAAAGRTESGAGLRDHHRRSLQPVRVGLEVRPGARPGLSGHRRLRQVVAGGGRALGQGPAAAGVRGQRARPAGRGADEPVPMSDEVSELLAQLEQLCDGGGPLARADRPSRSSTCPGRAASSPTWSSSTPAPGRASWSRSSATGAARPSGAGWSWPSAGCPSPIVFVAGKHLRVSEEALPGHGPGGALHLQPADRRQGPARAG